MVIESACAPPFLKNGFVLSCERTRQAIYIDPGDEVEELLDYVARESLTVVGILLTHAHMDHVSGVAAAKRALGAPIWLHPADRAMYAHARDQGAMFGYDLEQPPPPDRWYELPGPIAFGDYDVFIHHTPGHCPGNVCLQVGKRGTTGMDLFVGDTLFAGSIGRTDLPGGNYEVLMRAITDVLLPFGDDARVRPGHGPDTTIGRERQTNPFLLEWAAAQQR
jgi:glyoxylase-like metal-dependent hydrolase (beta-lactamase superfamily II)